jgi:hypothetical protein
MAKPKVGVSYRQEYYKGQAEDWASVLSLSKVASILAGSYSKLLITREWSALEAKPVYDHKYYDRGVGFVMSKSPQNGELKLIGIRYK